MKEIRMKEKIVDCKLNGRKVNKFVECPGLPCKNCLEVSKQFTSGASKETKNQPKKHPKEPIKKRKISYYDRLQAIKRNPKFIKEYEEYKRFEQKTGQTREQEIEQEIELTGLPDLLECILKKGDLGKKWELNFKILDYIDKIIAPSPYITNCMEVVSSIDKKPINLELDISGNKHLKGERLYLEIDLSNTREELQEVFKLIINHYKELYEKSFIIRKNRKTTYDPWKVYDMHVKQNLNFTEIARRLAGIKGSSTYNNNLKTARKAVKNAYDYAEKMIKQVGKETLSKNNE